MREHLYVSRFYRDACPTLARFDEMISEPSRPMVLKQVVTETCEDLKKGRYSKEKVKAALSERYLDSFFAYPAIKAQSVEDDTEKIDRFVKILANDKILTSDYAVGIDLGEDRDLFTRADIIFQDKKSGHYGAMVIKVGKADKSPGGKAVHTRTATDLHLMVLKAVLERKYPHIAVSLVYLTNDADSLGNIGPFVVSTTRKSNIFTETYEDYYEEGKFQFSALRTKIKEVLSQPPAPSCFNCFEKQLCTTDTVATMGKAKAKVAEEEKPYTMPDFTDTQQKVIDHIDGPMLVCAGPGSGKTATLVGRGKHLVDVGVDPEFILCVTFTNKAVDELKTRFTSCLGSEIPKCCTFHSLALEILRQNETMVGPVAVMARFDEVKLLKEMTELSTKPLAGFTYGSGEAGKNAFLTSLATKVEGYMADPEGFKKREKKVGDDFYALADEFISIVRSRGYLTFDEVIRSCLTLFKEHPEVKDRYTAVFKYVMVDEFQDVNREQAEFIYLLASHGNLVVVGDDDQNIYEWRSASSRFMQEFGRKGEVKTIVLDKNFRSTASLVEAGQELIAKNRERIKKNVGAVRGKGMAPVVVNGQSAEEVGKAVADAVKAGYKYSDIAVLAWKNPTLEELSRTADFPNVLGKAFLVDHVMFRIALDVLSMHFKGPDDRHMVHFFTVMGAEGFADGLDCTDGLLSGLRKGGYYLSDGRPDKKKASEGEVQAKVYNALSLLYSLERALQKNASAFYFLDTLMQRFSMEDSSVAQAFDGLVESRHIKTAETLYEVCQYMADFGDDTRLDPEQGDSVLLLTSHESKGMEFPVVIMVDDYKSDKEESTTRLYYVAMTRAKDRLYILRKDSGEKTLFDLVA